MTDRVVVIFVEGDTEVVFYKRLVAHIREKHNGRLSCKVEYKNLKGIGNYKKGALSYIRKSIIPKYIDAKITILLCHDTDVFEFSTNPPVNWENVQKGLVSLEKVDRVELIKAKRSIENWFLLDRMGILRFLKLPLDTKSQGDGLEEMKRLFRKVNKVYIKGNVTNDFVPHLNIELITSAICNEIKPLCKALGMNCKTPICKP
ncbi:MAG: hypothetical protein LBM18_00710 [Oscillospiraceae bacterium]|jgi:hypothetical protein|nr:hypothetical protein [Oscillospiraceae bacterium]